MSEGVASSSDCGVGCLELARAYRVRHVMSSPVEWLEADERACDAQERLRSIGFSYAPLQLGESVGLVAASSLPDGDAPLGEYNLHLLTTMLHAEDELIGVAEWLATQPAYLVQRDSQVVGIVHYSDLNKLPLRACVYLFVMDLESKLLGRVAEACPDMESWVGALGTERVEQIRQAWAKHCEGDAGLTPLMELGLRDLLVLCQRELGEGLPGLSDRAYKKEVLERVSRLRNRVAHACKAVARERSGMRDLQHGLEVVAKLVEVLAGTE